MTLGTSISNSQILVSPSQKPQSKNDLRLSRISCARVYEEWDRRNAHGKKRSYTLAADIWSFGVTVFQSVYDLPSSHAERVFWCEEVVKKLKRDLKRDPDNLKQFL